MMCDIEKTTFHPFYILQNGEKMDIVPVIIILKHIAFKPSTKYLKRRLEKYKECF